MSGYDGNYITAMKQIILNYQANYVKLGKFMLACPGVKQIMSSQMNSVLF